MGFLKAKWSRSQTMANLAKIAPEASKALAKVQLDAAFDLAEAMAMRAPVRSGRYRSSFDAGLLSSGPRGKGVAAQTKDPNATGVWASFIWRFLEFGTVKQKAQPHIFPTYRAHKKDIKRKISAAARKAIKAAAVSGGGG